MARLTPSFVFQLSPILFARIAAVVVQPLLPPQPTSISPSFGFFRAVRNSYATERGVATALPSRTVTSVVR